MKSNGDTSAADGGGAQSDVEMCGVWCVWSSRQNKADRD